jgi:hypothetical protein
MKLFIAGLLLAAPLSALAQSFNARADLGDAVANTDVGQKFMDKVAPDLVRASFGCLHGQERLTPGTVITIVMDVASDGTASRLEVQPGNASASCIQNRLAGFKPPAPTGWNWSRGQLPFTFRITTAQNRAATSQGESR